VEDLDLSARAYNTLKTRGVDFIDQIDLDALKAAYEPPGGVAGLQDIELDDPLRRKVRTEIAEKLRKWRDDSGEAPSPIRP
jgi:hypothetical protein